MTLFKHLPLSFTFSFNNRVLITLVLLLIATVSWSQEKLVLIGGGPGRPKQALKQFSDWAHQEKGTILIIAWASEIPIESANDLIVDFSFDYKGFYDISPSAPQTPAEQAYFLNQLRYATGIFFSGGDQSKIMAAFDSPTGNRIRTALVSAYKSGKVFGGTSAGTAIMSKLMITGNIQDDGIVPLNEGLGLLPSNLIVDQHFSQRARAPRLLRAHKTTGTDAAIGIDEDTALIVTDNQNAVVSGQNTVRVFTGTERHPREWILTHGHQFRLPNP